MSGALPRNPDVADQFDLLADILELEGGDTFRVLAYRRAAARIRDTGESIAQLALDGTAKKLQGIGKTIEGKIVEIVELGEPRALTKHRALVPSEVVRFVKLPGLGPKTARRIWQELGVTTMAELREAAAAQRLRTLSGLGPKVEENVLRALEAEASAPREARALLGTALPAVLEAVEALRAHPAAEEVSEAGSVRRRRETVRDVDIIATARDADALIACFVEQPWVVSVTARGGTKATVVSELGPKFDLRVVQPECFGNLLQHFTGSKHHNVALREDAQRNGLSVSEYGITVVETGEVLMHRDEASLYERLGYAYIPPELREAAGELEAARAGTLPALVETVDLRGDLHAHSTWSSDGKATVEEMALAARARGYAYIAMTDHSHYLREGRLEQQAEEIAALNERLVPFRILRGVEANIRPDGSVDVADADLARLDWVVASIHASFDRDPTARVLAAMENPYVRSIGHPTGRKIGKRDGMALDVDRVVAKALETGTALEINGQPDRLDLPDPLARVAGEAGVPIVCSSDGHRVAALAYAELAVAQARRAWLTAGHVLNTRPWDEIAGPKRPR